MTTPDAATAVASATEVDDAEVDDDAPGVELCWPTAELPPPLQAASSHASAAAAPHLAFIAAPYLALE